MKLKTCIWIVWLNRLMEWLKQPMEITRQSKNKSLKNKIPLPMNKLIPILLLLCACNSEIKESAPQGEHKTQKQQTQEIPYKNPALVFGTSFGHYVQSLFRNARYSDLLMFTSSQTRTKFGDKELLKYYKEQFRFGYQLGPLSNIKLEGDTLVLTYAKANIIATKRIIRIKVLIENDSCKLVLSNLKPNPF